MAEETEAEALEGDEAVAQHMRENYEGAKLLWVSDGPEGTDIESMEGWEGEDSIYIVLLYDDSDEFVVLGEV